MKTRYRSIRFRKQGERWICYTKEGACALGYCEPCPPWGRLLFFPHSFLTFSADTLLDIAHFLYQFDRPCKPPSR